MVQEQKAVTLFFSILLVPLASIFLEPQFSQITTYIVNLSILHTGFFPTHNTKRRLFFHLSFLIQASGNSSYYCYIFSYFFLCLSFWNLFVRWRSCLTILSWRKSSWLSVQVCQCKQKKLKSSKALGY